MELNRRQLLCTGGGIGAAALLTACGAGDTPSPGAAEGSPARPKRGGTLRVGALGRASAITRDPHGTQANESDYLILSLVYDTLTVPGAKPNTLPRLAASWTPSDDLRTWRLTLAEGARFHDGTPVTAEDVAFSLRRLRGTPSGASRLPGIRAGNIKADGRGTVVLVSDYANAELPLLLRLTTFVVRNGTKDGDIGKAPGTGPFRLEWFRGGNARLVRNDGWYGGEVPLDAVEVKIFESPQAMANALLGGQIDLASNVGAVAARTAGKRKDVRVVRRPNDLALPVVMRTAPGSPFADPRVREALRLAVDREAMVRQVLSGYGSVANDILGTGDPGYAKDVPQRVRDLARAGSLLKEAGFDLSRTYELVTTEDVPGLAETATLFATQVREAGVRIKVTKQESAAFWARTWLKGDLYTSYWGTNDSVVFFAGKVLVSESATNESGWKDPGFDAAYRTALATKDPAKRAESLRRVQRIQHDASGYLLWGMADGIDLAAAAVRGLPTLPGYGRVQLERAWLNR
ncbi:ABC transporter substrate-binding protein [Streptomyces huiliensis]|uniref:ABC transporter substrate-binding protein n=1 Tax=Streptomyces huiliensis TaxID=2876027 RepID=UPI001CBB97C0|nr:ABC transporter substrate-binding protein [Streptomyces huiliensis]MBZ4320451.1 ABC transporter substrate-binding protein [Streptomyces huiliensis]